MRTKVAILLCGATFAMSGCKKSGTGGGGGGGWFVGAEGLMVNLDAETNAVSEYDLGATYGGLYDDIVAAIDSLSLAPYKLEAYKKK